MIKYVYMNKFSEIDDCVAFNLEKYFYDSVKDVVRKDIAINYNNYKFLLENKSLCIFEIKYSSTENSFVVSKKIDDSEWVPILQKLLPIM